ncbi:ribonuclease J [Brevibacterium sp. 50QC2O2]|uniref:ribonuclease J n=1 Tax=Brevibacterium TaxID=1696 RepID=UPI00211BC396|nr:ribonuclease J [Brevibacterium sp. 91QC2O2]MCQ9384988.1 ribonuclease J [Brevibacterium sp. 68QC2CO]MCQ9387965.1 ribonuclease J [Brevibacterium sp. 50QC2O2]
MRDLLAELGEPPKLDRNALRIVALGGLGEVGRNMTVYEFHGKLLIVDCGVLFPEEEQPGVDLILPDFSYLEGRWKDVVGMVLTHGHEDHIGAVPYLLRNRKDIPILGSVLTLALVEAKLKEHRIKAVTRVVHEGDKDQLGPFDLEFVAVNHSIPDALAVCIRTEAGTCLHTGDFKMDQLPLDGRITDLRSFARLGEEGIDLFLTDSTNAEVPGFTKMEKNIGPVLESLFGQAEGRIIVASFSSHVHRVQQVLNAASAHGRRVCLVGRSMVRNMKIAQELGYLNVPFGVLVDLKDVDSLPEDQVVLMCTGSQGEPMAALSRMANGTHRIQLNSDDTVILASSLIPGNENSVSRVINGLMKAGATVISKANANVHVSGHASAGELLYTYNIVKPKGVFPVHGEWRHLIANAKLAQATGVPEENIVLADDGWVVDLKNGHAEVVGAVDCDYVFVDGSSVGTVTEADLEDRRVLAGEGFVSVFLTVDAKNQSILAGPVIHTRGVAENDKVFDTIKPKITEAIQDALNKGTKDEYKLQQAIRRTLGRWISSKLRRKPMIVPMVVVVRD